jgi:predicted RNA-binding Zn ribbon-like protein
MQLPSWVQADETKPAPMPLLLVQAFVNTFEADHGTDQLMDAGTARSWLTEAGLLDNPSAIDSQDLSTVRCVREAIRALLEANAEGNPPRPDQLAPLREAARSGVVRAVLGNGGSIELDAEAATALDRMFMRLILIMRDAQRDGTWYRLKACANSECRWAYYDRSHSNRGRWCDMAVCGNRIKNRNLRARRH